MTATNQMKSVAASSGKKLQPGKAYRVQKPAQKSSWYNKMKNMAASCSACAGK